MWSDCASPIIASKSFPVAATAEIGDILVQKGRQNKGFFQKEIMTDT